MLDDIFNDINGYVFGKLGVDLNHAHIDGTKIGVYAFASDMDCFQPLIEVF